MGKQFRALAKAAGLTDVRIHDLRHAGATILMTLGVPDPIVRKITGHRSRELERYQHLTPELRALTVNLIATELFRAKRAKNQSGTPTGTVRPSRLTKKAGRRQVLDSRRVNGGVDGTSFATGLFPQPDGFRPAARPVAVRAVPQRPAADFTVSLAPSISR